MKRGVLRTAEGGRLMFRCPGCEEMHQVQVGDGPGPRWAFNDDYERPSFAPSILVRGTRHITADEHERIMAGETIKPEPTVCHSFVAEGSIQFLGDCTHPLAGQTVPLPYPDVGEGAPS